MKLVLIFLCLATMAFCFVWFLTYLTLKKNYKYYKLTYFAIKNKDYLLYRNDEDFITFRPKDKMDIPIWQFTDDEILYFKDNDTIKLTKGYIHKDFMPFFDPYTVYWHNKIKEQITINSSLENMRDYKLKQLNIK